MVSAALGHQVGLVTAVSRALERQVGSGTAFSGALGRQVGPGFGGKAGRAGRAGVEGVLRGPLGITVALRPPIDQKPQAQTLE